MIVRREVEQVDGLFTEKIIKCSAKQLAREIIVDVLHSYDGLVRYAEGMDKEDWENMTKKEQEEVARQYNKYLNRIFKILGE
jgi:ferritin-like protein